jgi:hypothetical protein
MIDGEGEPFVILGLASVCLLLTGLVLYMSIPDGFHLERRHFVYVGMAAIALLIYVAALAALYHSQDRQDFWKYLGLYLGPALVALGWVVTNEVNVLNSRKQHTINLILQYFTNAKRIEDKDRINSQLAWPAKIDAAKFNFDDTANPLLRTIARELNYFDFLASAILRREIEDRLLRRVFQDIVRHYYIQCEPYILHWQQKNPETWADLAALYDRWKLPTDPTRGAP